MSVAPNPAAGPAPQRLVPVDDDLDTGGFFQAAKQHQIAIRRCNGCDAVLHMPVAYCRHCGSWESRWQQVDGRASLYSWTVVEHQVHPAYPVPHTIVLVDLDELPGTRLLGRLDGAPQLHAGQPMKAWFEETDAGVVIPQWRPVSDE